MELKLRSKLWLSTIVLSVLPSIHASAQTSPPNGLVIERMAKDSWQVVLKPTSGSFVFSGTFEATLPILQVDRVNLETADKTDLEPLQKKSLAVTLRVTAPGSDGVNFQTSDGSGLCLRGIGATIYLAIANRFVEVKSPVDLTNSGACGGTPTALKSPTDGRKFNAGHFLALSRANDSQSVMYNSMRPGLQGFMKRYTWRQLEPSLGVYDFSEISSDLAFVSSYGLQLVVMIEDKTFDSTIPLPSYLADKVSANVAGGYTAVRWDPYVVARMQALLKMLGKKFDSKANFEGVAFQETALGIASAQLTALAYTPEKMRDAIITELNSATANLPTSRVFWFMNFLAGAQYYIGDIARIVTGTGVVMGGPDVMPDDPALNKHTYPFYTSFAGQIPLFGQVEEICYAHLHADTSYPTAYWTPEELFGYAREKMFVNYMFWVRSTRVSPAGSYNWLDAVSVFADFPVF